MSLQEAQKLAKQVVRDVLATMLNNPDAQAPTPLSPLSDEYKKQIDVNVRLGLPREVLPPVDKPSAADVAGCATVGEVQDLYASGIAALPQYKTGGPV